MKSQELKSIVEKIKQYGLSKAFSSTDELDKWLKNLNQKQIDNFINLTIKPNEIEIPLFMIIDENLLNCDDYEKRIRAFNEIKSGEGCYHLFDRFCSLNFLNSKTFYEDVKLISKASTPRYALWVVAEESFAKSPYRNEDLKMIVKAEDTCEEERDWLVAESLARVAECKESILSPYHREDMKLISTCGSDALQMTGSYPEYGVNRLATNSVSLKDPYHRENMQILSEAPVSSEYLYKLMTNKNAIKRKTYREEIEALKNAKSEITAMAIYNFIEKEENRSYELTDMLSDVSKDPMFSLNAYELGKNKTILGTQHPKYFQCLNLLNKVESKFSLFIASILADENSIKSGEQEEDIKTILQVTDEKIFMDLYRVMTNKDSLEYIDHRYDVQLIANEKNNDKRRLLVLKAINPDSLILRTHSFDMEYISKLDLESIDQDRYKKIYYYLFNGNGLTHPKHQEILEKLYNNEPIEEIDEVYDYLSEIEKHSQKYVTEETPKKGFFSRILRRK